MADFAPFAAVPALQVGIPRPRPPLLAALVPTVRGGALSDAPPAKKGILHLLPEQKMRHSVKWLPATSWTWSDPPMAQFPVMRENTARASM